MIEVLTFTFAKIDTFDGLDCTCISFDIDFYMHEWKIW